MLKTVERLLNELALAALGVPDDTLIKSRIFGRVCAVGGSGFGWNEEEGEYHGK